MENLQTFNLLELEQFTKEGKFASGASKDHHLFFVGRDNVDGLLQYLLGRVNRSLYLNMFGYDNETLNDLCMKAAENPDVTTVITLDKSQAGGVHEKKILASDAASDEEAFDSHFAIGQSATHQISHTKGGVLDGKVGFEGSTNLSASGEGVFVVGHDQPGGPKFKAQNNTLMVFTDPDAIASFTAELVSEHLIAVSQGGKLSGKK